MADFISNSSFQACSKSHNRWFLQDIVDTLILYHFGVKKWKKTLLCFTAIFLRKSSWLDGLGLFLKFNPFKQDFNV